MLLAKDSPLFATLTRGRKRRSPRQWHTALLLAMALTTLKKRSKLERAGKRGEGQLTKDQPGGLMDASELEVSTGSEEWEEVARDDL